MLCCKKCPYQTCGYCEILNYDINAISYTPCNIPVMYLDNGEKYMRENDRGLFIKYINELLNIKLHIGDEICFINNNYNGYWHNDNTPSVSLKIISIEKNGDYLVIDPNYNAGDEMFANHLISMPYSFFEPSDFDDIENDRYIVSSNWHNRFTPITERPERNVIKFISERMN